MRAIQSGLRQAVLRTRVHRQIKLHALAALAHKKAGNENLAHRSIEQALALAAPGGYIRALIDEGEDMSQLLLEHLRPSANSSELQQGSATYAFLARLIGTGTPETQTQAQPSAHARPASRGFASTPPPVEPFTDREKKMLSMMVNYMSNQQIAAATFVTRDTVKYHLKNIYGKLGVKSRLEAIRAVHEGRVSL